MRGELNLVCDRVDLFGDVEGANISETELFCRAGTSLRPVLTARPSDWVGRMVF